MSAFELTPYSNKNFNQQNTFSIRNNYRPKYRKSFYSEILTVHIQKLTTSFNNYSHSQFNRKLFSKTKLTYILICKFDVGHMI